MLGLQVYTTMIDGKVFLRRLKAQDQGWQTVAWVISIVTCVTLSTAAQTFPNFSSGNIECSFLVVCSLSSEPSGQADLLSLGTGRGSY